MNAGLAIWKLAFQLSPVVLVDGIATGILGSMLPIIAITEAAHFLSGILSGSENLELDDFFAHFQPMPGGSLIENQIGQYPFANQAVAGNAVIAQPLSLSMMMICPARDTLGYATKLVTMMALKRTLDEHIRLGGTFTVVTPSYFYTNGILVGMRDISNAQSHQVQNTWQLDFQFPLLTLEAAQSIQNSLMSKFTANTHLGPDASWSGPAQAVSSPDSLATGSILPSASGLPAANTAPFSSLA